MSEIENEPGPGNISVTQIVDPPETPQSDVDLVKSLVDKGVAEALKPIKEKLDGAYGARDEAVAKATAYEEKERKAELKRLSDDGEHRKVYEIQLKEQKTRADKAEAKNVELTRDVDVRSALTGLDFRNESAAAMATREITDELVKNEGGAWVHRSGISIKDFVSTYSENQAKSFLFKPRVSSGAGDPSPTGLSDPTPKKRSLFEMTQEEVFKMAEEGTLPSQQT